VSSSLRTLALTALFAMGASVTLAQEADPLAAPAHEKAEPARERAEPAAERAEPEPGESTEGTTGKNRSRAGRDGRAVSARHARMVVRRAALARAEAEAAAKAAPTLEPLQVGEAEPKAENSPSEKPAAAVDALPALAGGLDALPAIAPVHEQGVPEHVGAAGVPVQQAAAHEASATAAGHGEHGTERDEHGTEHGEHGAEHGESAGFSVGTFALQLFNFGILLFLLIWFGGRAMNKSLRARHEQLKGDINESARLRDEATRKFKAQDQRVEDLEKEVAALRASMKQDAEREQARLMEGARERAKRISDDMRFQLNQQVKEAESSLRAEVASASVKLAEELVRKSLTTEDERRLAREFVAGFDMPSGPTGEVR